MPRRVQEENCLVPNTDDENPRVTTLIGARMLLLLLFSFYRDQGVDTLNSLRSSLQNILCFIRRVIGTLYFRKNRLDNNQFSLEDARCSVKFVREGLKEPPQLQLLGGTDKAEYGRNVRRIRVSKKTSLVSVAGVPTFYSNKIRWTD